MIKKTSFVLAFMGRPATLLAQSSLTLYGVADAAVGKVKSNGTSRTLRMTSSGLMNNDDDFWASQAQATGAG